MFYVDIRIVFASIHLMKPTILAVLFLGMLHILFIEGVMAKEGPLYDEEGHLISYLFSDGTRYLYTYDT